LVLLDAVKQAASNNNIPAASEELTDLKARIAKLEGKLSAKTPAKKPVVSSEAGAVDETVSDPV
jgi:BMFP domain-containing protein YqiC